jgi:membrane protein YqaA with SNARE-associated domain
VESGLTRLGYLGAFLMSIISSTPLPLTPELALVPLLSLGYSPFPLFVCTVGGSYLGALLSYAMGRTGGRFMLAHVFTVSARRQLQAETYFQRWGSAALFFSWLPIIGDPIAFVGGLLRTPLREFTLWVVLGRGLRFAVVIWILSTAVRS